MCDRNLKSLFYNVNLFQFNTILHIISISIRFPISGSKQNNKMTFKKMLVIEY